MLASLSLQVARGEGLQLAEPRVARISLGRPTPHPAVVRVMVPEGNATSHGSGTLVDTHDRYGLVVTNWHVVQDARSTIMVVFPDGFQTGARVLKTDRDWDLAALAIWRPRVQPVPIALQPPQPGETLTIAGYGSGNYRSVSGRCTQYVSPGGQLPYEMVEVAVRARQGDSGGPIFNQRGEMAGVLFGSGSGRTSGSYAGRVRQFLSTVWPPAEMPNANLAGQVAPADPGALGQGMGAQQQERRPFVPVPRSAASGNYEQPVDLSVQGVTQLPRESSTASVGPRMDTTLYANPSWQADDLELANSNLGLQTSDSTPQLAWRSIAGESLTDQAKTVLAAIGVVVVLVHVLRFLGGSQ
ncbi:MAG: serine protease [Planctomycetota bacterium]|nr:serine protease [Planctomycetota bacterium]